MVARKSRLENQLCLELILERLTKFLNVNCLSVNKSKTLLQELMIKQRQCKAKGVPAQLITFNDKGDIKVIKATKFNILLGATL